MSVSKFKTDGEAKKAKWFSRRHQTSEAHMKASQAREEHDRKKFFGPEERAAARAARTPQEQLAVLDARLGKGVGAEKERARLAKLIAAK